jgi:hypothetical protein
MLHYEFITWFSRELLLNNSCCTTESSQYPHVNFTWMNGSCGNIELPQHYLVNSWMAHVGLWNHSSILSWTPPKWLILEDEIAVAFSSELLPNSTCCTMKSSQHYHVISSWTAHVGLRNHNIILNVHSDSPWLAHVEIWNQHSILSWAPPEWITTALSHELLLN